MSSNNRWELEDGPSVRYVVCYHKGLRAFLGRGTCMKDSETDKISLFDSKAEAEAVINGDDSLIAVPVRVSITMPKPGDLLD
jgi:hypothetical protein